MTIVHVTRQALIQRKRRLKEAYDRLLHVIFLDD